MPIDYQCDDLRRLITVTLTDPFSFDELLNFRVTVRTRISGIRAA